MKTFFTVLLGLMGQWLASQTLKETLLRAHSSVDSSAYFFHMAKKQIKTTEDAALYFFCKNARCTDVSMSDSAIYYGKRALSLYAKMPQKDWNSIFTIQNNLINVYRDRGEYDKALQIGLENVRLAEQKKMRNWVAFYDTQLSYLYHDFESYKRGVFYGKRSLANWNTQKNVSNAYIASTLNAIAINYDDWNQPDSALYYHRKTLHYFKGDDTLSIASTYNNIGNTLLKQKKYREAQRWITSALKIIQHNAAKNPNVVNTNYQYELATFYTNLAQIAFQLREFSEAGMLFDKAYVASKESQNAEKLRDLYLQRMAFYKATANYKQLATDQERYIQLRDSIFEVAREKNFSELEAKYQNEKKEKELVVTKAKITQKENELQIKNIQTLVLVGISMALLALAYLVYRQQKLKNYQQQQEFELKSAIGKIETQNKLQEQRLQISRDLHDNIGAQLTFIISSIDNIKYAFQLEKSPLQDKLSGISTFARATIIELRDTIWAMNKSEITFEDLQARIHNFIDKAKEVNTTIQFRFLIDGDLKAGQFSSVEGMNIYRTIQEALNNSIKYAQATRISVVIKRVNSSLHITISDDGIGFDPSQIIPGNGIQNMKKRTAELSGTLEIQTKHRQGTSIRIVLPYAQYV